MRLFHDLDYGYFTSVRGGSSPLKRIDLKVGDEATIELEFFKSGTLFVPASLDELIFVIKTGYGEDDPALALILTEAWETESDSDESIQVFRATLGLNGDLLRTALDTAASVSLKAELTATLDGLGPDTTATVTARVFNDLWKGAESSPSLLPTPDDEWLAHGHSQTLSNAQKEQAAANQGTVAYDDLASANLALPPGRIYYDRALGYLHITTA